MLHFAISLGFISLLCYNAGQWHGAWVWFTLPYALLLLAFFLAFGFALQGRVRLAMKLFFPALICSMGMFVYDISNERAQPFVTTLGESRYLIWWWWER
jgi:hypothetical protein